MYKKLLFLAFSSSLFVGCASVPMESLEKQSAAKQFPTPTEGNSGLYIYRSGTFGGALKKDVWVDGKCVGETAPNVFFYHEVTGDKEHHISTESEFSPNGLFVQTKSGSNYFIQQYIKVGAFVGGAGLKQVDQIVGEREVAKLNMAQKGNCSK